MYLIFDLIVLYLGHCYRQGDWRGCNTFPLAVCKAKYTIYVWRFYLDIHSLSLSLSHHLYEGNETNKWHKGNHVRKNGSKSVF